MGELTSNIPKPMLEVEGKPVLEKIILGLRDEAGIRNFLIIIGWYGDVIRDHFGDGTKWGVGVTYREQVVQDGTGKAPNWLKTGLERTDFFSPMAIFFSAPRLTTRSWQRPFRRRG